MLEIDFNKKTMKGVCKAKDIREKGLFKASAESDLKIPLDLNRVG